MRKTTENVISERRHRVSGNLESRRTTSLVFPIIIFCVIILLYYFLFFLLYLMIHISGLYYTKNSNKNASQQRIACIYFFFIHHTRSLLTVNYLFFKLTKQFFLYSFRDLLFILTEQQSTNSCFFTVSTNFSHIFYGNQRSIIVCCLAMKKLLLMKKVVFSLSHSLDVFFSFSLQTLTSCST